MGVPIFGIGKLGNLQGVSPFRPYSASIGASLTPRPGRGRPLGGPPVKAPCARRFSASMVAVSPLNRNLESCRHVNAADETGNAELKGIPSNRPQQFRRRHHRDCRIDKSRFIACYNDIRASGKRGTILNLILKVFCEICDCISNGPRSDGNYR